MPAAQVLVLSEYRAPDDLIEDFREYALSEVIIIGPDTPERRRECWRAYLEMCVANNVLTEHEASKIREPAGLLNWIA